MKEFKLGKEHTYFHEGAHLYFNSLKDYNGFAASWEKNNTNALRRKSTWNPVPSITQILSDWDKFTAGDFTIAKFWFTKEALYKGAQRQWIKERVDTLTEVEDFLKQSVIRTQVEGNEGHELIQNFLKTFVETGKASISSVEDNVYFLAFVKELKSATSSTLRDFVKNIKKVLPSEIPTIGLVSINEEYKFAGKWDLLVEMNNGEIVLVDIKTGSNLRDNKELKVGLQLNGYETLINQTHGIEVDKLVCWELSYTIPYKELTRKIKAEGKKINADTILLSEMNRELSKYSSQKGHRDYYWKEHTFERSDAFKKIVLNYFGNTIIKKQLLEEKKEKHKKEK